MIKSASSQAERTVLTASKRVKCLVSRSQSFVNFMSSVNISRVLSLLFFLFSFILRLAGDANEPAFN
jgi:hypothetical protein